MGKNLDQQIHWLIKNYCDYSPAWYHSNPARTQAIFNREYAKASISQYERLKMQLQQEREEKIVVWDQRALNRYHKCFQDLTHLEKRSLALEEEIYG